MFQLDANPILSNMWATFFEQEQPASGRPGLRTELGLKERGNTNCRSCPNVQSHFCTETERDFFHGQDFEAQIPRPPSPPLVPLLSLVLSHVSAQTSTSSRLFPPQQRTAFISICASLHHCAVVTSPLLSLSRSYICSAYTHTQVISDIRLRTLKNKDIKHC